MAWYRTGTVNVTNGSVNVVGVGTAFVANVSIGEGFLGPDGRVYEVANVVSNTALTLAAGYQGATANAQGYAILPTQSALADLAAEAAELVASFASVRDGAGQGMFGDGTVGVPGLRFAADQDTGIFRPGANTMALATGGSERARLTGGDLSLGTLSNYGRLSVAGGSSNPDGVPIARLTTGGGATTDETLAFGIVDGSHAWIQGVKLGTAYRNLVLNPLSGNVGIGTTPAVALDVAGATRAIHYTFRQSGAAPAGDAGMYRAADNTLAFSTASGERMRINASGDVGVGTADPQGKMHVAGTYVSTGGVFVGAAAGEARFYGTASGGCSLVGRGATYDINFGSYSGASAILVPTGTGNVVIGGTLTPSSDNAQTLGGASARWSQLYAGTTTINTSDEREKTWRGELSDGEYAAGLRVIDELGFFQWNDAVAEKGDAARLHFGARAQRVWGIFADAGLVDPIKGGQPGSTPYGFLCFDEWDETRHPVFETRTRTIKDTVETGEFYKGGKRKGEPKTRTVERQEDYEHDTGETRVVVPAGNRYGLRTTDLALFLLAVNARRQGEIEKRLAALEK